MVFPNSISRLSVLIAIAAAADAAPFMPSTPISNSAQIARSALAESENGTWDGCFYQVDGVGAFNSQFNFDFTIMDSLPDELTASTYTVGSGPYAPYAHNFDPDNIIVGGGEPLQMMVPGGQTEDPLSTSQMVTAFDDVLYASVRTVAQVSPVNGTVHGIFMYMNDTQETDIEIRTGDLAHIHCTNQQTHYGNGETTYTVDAPSDMTSAFHEYRYDWLPNGTHFYIDGELVQSININTPSEPGWLMWNNWSNGWQWTMGPPLEDNIMLIRSISAFFNRTSTATSGCVAGSASTTAVGAAISSGVSTSTAVSSSSISTTASVNTAASSSGQFMVTSTDSSATSSSDQSTLSSSNQSTVSSSNQGSSLSSSQAPSSKPSSLSSSQASTSNISEYNNSSTSVSTTTSISQPMASPSTASSSMVLTTTSSTIQTASSSTEAVVSNSTSTTPTDSALESNTSPSSPTVAAPYNSTASIQSSSITPTSGTNSSTTASTTPTQTLSCPASNNTLYIDPTTSLPFWIECGLDHSGGDLNMIYVSSFAACVTACASNSSCVDVSLSGAACYMKSTLGSAVSDAGVFGARLVGGPTAVENAGLATNGTLGVHELIQLHVDAHLVQILSVD